MMFSFVPFLKPLKWTVDLAKSIRPWFPLLRMKKNKLFSIYSRKQACVRLSIGDTEGIEETLLQFLSTLDFYFDFIYISLPKGIF